MFKLSIFHRIGIAVLTIIIIAAFFIPADDKNSDQQIAQNQPQPIVVPPPTAPEIVTQAPSEEPTISSGTDDTQTRLPNEPEIIQEPPVETVPPTTVEQPKQPVTPSEPKQTTPTEQEKRPATRPSTNNWQNYQVQKGKTLAQLFRDNHLQANDAFIMARVEGPEKPLSNLRQGQKIRLKANAKGEVQLLEVTTAEGKTVSFARLSDGSYYRTP
ncbi:MULTISPECIES: LysM-like peptidoglycan-binding domain-containing protein [Providencia]|uniref:LysM-like peptidoglycan-binding domain-containing protein n=1 Tax=Providencia TaxID=586 RepID=UPI000EF86476|nr:MULTISPECIES: LysM-like peptidoglycan-binding domain-containing protein [Providencia]EMF0918007.1 cell envelope opacity-associated protein A [Providencia stuartii]MCR4079781.1 cell envelope opacity-associated protein A [Providencia stuartii]MTC19149.1 cell envelope opacity-associated protein A [Providencia stuartii]RMA15531.1 cell envelope opacity-associated protein A [Providencia stuartii]